MTRGLLLPVLAFLLVGSAYAATASPPPSEETLLKAGKEIYFRGRLPDGSTIRAEVQQDVPLQGSRYACVNCHRRSGIGSSEGGDLIPPIIGSSVFAPRTAGLHKQYPNGGMYKQTRPAYTTETLARALRKGIDPAGRELSPLMPRFELDDQDVMAIAAYLRSLTISLPPGISERKIHFATITTPGNESARHAVLGVFNAFFKDKNARTRNEPGRAEHAPYHKEWVYDAYRQWELHEWQLSGPEHSWPGQLHDHYAQQPVFAVIGGVGNGDWQQVHRFCEKQELPCLLPQLSRPPAQADNDFYSIYFSRGVELEARALARTLAAADKLAPKVVQVLRSKPAASAAAATLRSALEETRKDLPTDIVVQNDKPLSADFWSSLARDHGDSVWILWLGGEDIEGLAALTAERKPPPAIYLSASLQRDIPSLQRHPLHRHFTLLSPYRAPGNEKNTFRFSLWARLRKLPVSDLHVQSASFLAATLAGESLMHMRGNLSREYFIERIEHMMDNLINPSLYPRLSLAPGQRFAVKGCYVWEMGKDFDTAQWIVP